MSFDLSGPLMVFTGKKTREALCSSLMSSALVRATRRLYSSIATSPSSSSSSASDALFVSSVVSNLIHRRSKSRWSTLLSLYPRGFTAHQVSQILFQVRNNPRLALGFFRFTFRHSLSSPSLVSYSAIIHILARARLKSQARFLIKEAVRLFPHSNTDDVEDHSHHPLCLERPEIFETLVRTYRECDSAPFVFDLVVEACLELNRIDPSIEIARMLGSRGIPLRVSTCNALIDKVSRHRGCHCGYDLYKEIFGVHEHGMANKGGVGATLSPNVHTFNGLLLSFYQHGLLDRVEELWTEMKKFSNCEPNVSSYNILMAAYCANGEVAKAWKLWGDMTSKGLKQDIVAYNTVIGGYCKVREVEKAEELYREMVMRGIQTTCITYQHLIHGYWQIGDVESAILLHKDMQRKGFSPDSPTIDAVVQGLCSKARVPDALKLFNAASKSDDFMGMKTSYNHLIKGLCLEGQMKEALSLQAKMVGKGFLPDSETYHAFIDGYEEQGKPDEAETLRKEMVRTLCLAEG